MNPLEIFPMQKNNVPYGSDVSAGTYACADCGRQYSNQSKSSLPPCPDFKPSTHSLNGWNILTGQGDAVQDPYPETTETMAAIKQAVVTRPASKD